MAYRLLYLPGAESDIRALSPDVARRVRSGLERLAEDQLVLGPRTRVGELADRRRRAGAAHRRRGHVAFGPHEAFERNGRDAITDQGEARIAHPNRDFMSV